jgi:3-hydroxyacyl-CoA dehydrogenase/enoyl-CoA hydratase/3-hydroxybutyryl-CoA epimerase
MNTSAASWKSERDAEGIVWLTLDKPGTSTNVLSRPVLEELAALLTPLATEPPKGVVVRSGKTRREQYPAQNAIITLWAD